MSRERRKNSPELPIHLNDELLPPAQRWIDWVFTPAQQRQIEEGLHGVVRMEGIRDKGFPMPPGFKQTNLQHEGNILHDARVLNQTTSELPKYIDFSKVQIFGYGHDIPEFLVGVGDVQPTDRTKRDWARKRLEHKAAKNFLIPQIQDPEARADALRRYNEYIGGYPDNLEVQMAKYLDQRDGTITYAHIIFNRHSVTSPEILGRMKDHLWQTTYKLVVPAINLLTALPTQAAREEMRDIVIADLKTLEKFGPPEIARSWIKGLVA